MHKIEETRHGSRSVKAKITKGISGMNGRYLVVSSSPEFIQALRRTVTIHEDEKEDRETKDYM